VLDMLHSERFVDVSPEETWATLLDEGSYLCSPRTMYRLLATKHGGVKERRNQLTHPAYAKPELLAERPRARAASQPQFNPDNPGPGA
jgi:putative transposase